MDVDDDKTDLPFGKLAKLVEWEMRRSSPRK
jgi:hypothetical protein